MNAATSIQSVSYFRLALGLIPISVVIFLLWHWKIPIGTYLWATTRMLLQLFLVGFVLLFIFRTQNPIWVFLMVVVMFSVASWIALRPIPEKRKTHYFRALAALLLGGGACLLLVLLGIIELKPWYHPQYFIPLAGMIFANSMNGLSLAAERVEREWEQRQPPEVCRREAFKTAVLPITNSFMAVGLVAFPGMMTGQILAGVSPLLAARYQIIVMSMIFGSTGISAALYLYLVQRSRERAATSRENQGV